MKVGVIGDGDMLVEHLHIYIPPQTTELICGAARGVDFCVKRYGEERHIPVTVLRPDYGSYPRRQARFMLNVDIVDSADMVLIFCDGDAAVKRHTPEQYCRECHKPVRVYAIAVPCPAFHG